MMHTTHAVVVGDSLVIARPLMAAPARRTSGFAERVARANPKYRAVRLTKRAANHLAALVLAKAPEVPQEVAACDASPATSAAGATPAADDDGGGDDGGGDPDSDPEKPRFSLSATAHGGLTIETVDGQRANLAIIDENGRAISGDVSREVFKLAIESYRGFLIGKGHLKVHASAPALAIAAAVAEAA